MNSEMFDAKLYKAKPGERIEYHRGAYARSFEVGEMAWDAYVRGLVELVQQRHGEGDYSFYAIVRKHVMPPDLNHAMSEGDILRAKRKKVG